MANNTGIKFGGRQKGTPNKATGRLREAFTELLEGNMGKVQELFDKVAEKNPQKALELLLKLSEFALPKLLAIEVNNESEGFCRINPKTTNFSQILENQKNVSR